jgi:hypothetical protein
MSAALQEEECAQRIQHGGPDHDEEQHDHTMGGAVHIGIAGLTSPAEPSTPPTNSQGIPEGGGMGSAVRLPTPFDAYYTRRIVHIVLPRFATLLENYCGTRAPSTERKDIYILTETERVVNLARKYLLPLQAHTHRCRTVERIYSSDAGAR